MGASVRALRLHGSLTAIVAYAADQTLPDGEPNAQVVDYYDQGASVWEPVGRWHGRQADADGLVEVGRLELTRMVAGLSPLTGEPEGGVARQGAVVAWDLAFTVPKSISAWWGLADRSTRMAIVDAVDIAAAVTIDLAGGCVVRPAQAVLRPPPTPTRLATHFPAETGYRARCSGGDTQATGPGRASRVPVVTF